MEAHVKAPHLPVVWPRKRRINPMLRIMIPCYARPNLFSGD